MIPSLRRSYSIWFMLAVVLDSNLGCTASDPVVDTSYVAADEKEKRASRLCATFSESPYGWQHIETGACERSLRGTLARKNIIDDRSYFERIRNPDCVRGYRSFLKELRSYVGSEVPSFQMLSRLESDNIPTTFGARLTSYLQHVYGKRLFDINKISFFRGEYYAPFAVHENKGIIQVSNSWMSYAEPIDNSANNAFYALRRSQPRNVLLENALYDHDYFEYSLDIVIDAKTRDVEVHLTRTRYHGYGRQVVDDMCSPLNEGLNTITDLDIADGIQRDILEYMSNLCLTKDFPPKQ